MNFLVAEGRGIVGSDDFKLFFVVVSDGKSTKFMFPSYISPDAVQDMLEAFGSRIEILESNKFEDPKSILSVLNYNYPVEITVIDEKDTFKDAEELASNWLNLFDTENVDSFPIYNAIPPKGLEDEDLILESPEPVTEEGTKNGI